MSKSSAYIELKALIDGWVAEAHEQMVGSLSSAVRGELSLRYQQRLCLKREIENWIASAERGRDEIIEEMRRELDEQRQSDYASSTSSGT